MAVEFIDGRFRIRAPIAEGASGKVFLADDEQEGRPIALKIMHQRAAGNSEFVARFKRECRLLEEMNHQNAVRVFATGVTPEKSPYVAMELVEGATLDQLVDRDGPLDPAFVGKCLVQVARVLDFAHEKGIVHRDLKPGNIMVGKNDVVKVLDFGVAKILSAEQPDSAVVTAAGIAMGTPSYMSPEQAMGKKVSTASDIYAIGVTLFAVLTGRLPFDAKNDLQTMLAHVKSPVPRFSEKNPQNRVPETVEAVVRLAMAKDPSARPESATKLAELFMEAIGTPDGFFSRYPEMKISAAASMAPMPASPKAGRKAPPIRLDVPWTNVAAVVAVIAFLVAAYFLVFAQ